MKFNFWNKSKLTPTESLTTVKCRTIENEHSECNTASRQPTQHLLTIETGFGHSTGFYVWIVALSILVTINSYLCLRGRSQLEQHRHELHSLKRFVSALELRHQQQQQQLNDITFVNDPTSSFGASRLWRRSKRNSPEARSVQPPIPPESPQKSSFMFEKSIEQLSSFDQNKHGNFLNTGGPSGPSPLSAEKMLLDSTGDRLPPSTQNSDAASGSSSHHAHSDSTSDHSGSGTRRQHRRRQVENVLYIEPITEQRPGIDFYAHPRDTSSTPSKQQQQGNSGYEWLTAYSRIPTSVLEEFCAAANNRCPPGPSGPPGPKGEPGLDGVDGLNGEPGLDGVHGRDGRNGVDGRPGQPGPSGPQGKTGFKGERGPKGDTGDAGLPGIQGLQGPRGHPGKPGKDGKDGKPGLPGTAVFENWNNQSSSYEKSTQGYCGSCPACKVKPQECLVYARQPIRNVRVQFLPNVPNSISGVPKRKTACMLSQFGTPVLNSLYEPNVTGCWMRDAAPTRPGDEKRYWLVREDAPYLLEEFDTLELFGQRKSTRNYTLLYPFSGTGHAMHGGQFYYSDQNNFRLVMFHLDSLESQRLNLESAISVPGIDASGISSGQSRRKQTRDVSWAQGEEKHPHHHHHSEHRSRRRHRATPTRENLSISSIQAHKRLFTRQRNRFDIAVDENGVWLLYPNIYSAENNTVVIKLNGSRIEYIWNITLDASEVGETFIICGVLYGIESTEESSTKIVFAYDLFEGREIKLDKTISFNNPFRSTSFVSYNHLHHLLYTWGGSNTLEYQLMINTLDSASTPTSTERAVTPQSSSPIAPMSPVTKEPSDVW